MKKIKNFIYPVFIIAIFILIGIISFYFVYKNFNKRFSDEVIWATDISAIAINPDRVRATSDLLPGDISQSSDYSVIKEQTLGLGNLFLPKGVDAIYILSKKGNDIYFISESTPEGEPLYIAPGKLYEQPPQEIFQVFSNREAISTHVYTDEFGTYLSRFSPIFDNKTGELVGVLGVDIDYTVYQTQFWQIFIIFWLIWLFVCILVILLFFYFRNVYQLKNESITSEKKLRTIIDAVSSGIIVVDSKSQIVSWNNYCKNIFGFSLESVLGLKFSDVIKAEKIVNTETGEEISNFNFSLGSNLVGKVLELKILTDKKIEKYYELTMVIVEVNDEEYLVASLHDVSNRRQEENDLKVQKEELEKLNNLMVGRELKMVEMKKEISALEEDKK